MKCPKCNDQTLEKVKTEYGIVAMCQSCFGHYLLEKNILQYIPLNNWNVALHHEKNALDKKRIHCSSCKFLMDTHTLPEEYNSVQVDRCPQCKVIWFDKDKIEELNLQKKSDKDSLSKLNEKDSDKLAKSPLLDAKLKYMEKEVQRKKEELNRSNDSSGVLDAIEIIVDGISLLD